MFIRWQITDPVTPGYERMRVILIESVRINGKPRQRHIAFLGSVSYPRHDAEETWQFWQNARAVLDRLGNRILPAQRDDIEKALAKRIRPLTPAQIKACEQRAAEREQQKRIEMQEMLERLRAYQKTMFPGKSFPPLK